MPAKRIGEILSRLVPLSLHDVEEILSEQSARPTRRFGDIGLSLGLCRPEHVWRAWTAQLSESPRPIDLDELGIDAQAMSHVSAEVARLLRVIPVRALGDEIVIATESANLLAVAHALAQSVRLKLIVVAAADPAQLARAIEHYYPIAATASDRQAEATAA
jgi:hypothetical protein